MGVLRHFPRFLVMGFVVWWYFIVYVFGRIRTLFVAKGEARRAAVAHLRGRILRGLFSTLGATFVKLGQVLSTRPDLLDPEITDELRQLQDRLPPFPFAQARRMIEEDLKVPLEERFAEFDEKPVAAASVAQVHRARLVEKLGGGEVAVKVLRPDVRRKVERDAAILVSLARVIAWHPTWRLSDPVGHLEHFVSGILEQTNLDNEIANYARFRKNFDGVEKVRFPEVVEGSCGPRVMTMQFCRGVKLDALPSGDYRDLAVRLQRVILKMCFEDGFIHADLHPGNLLLEENGDLVIFDVGLVKQLATDLLLQFLDLTKCIAMGSSGDWITHLRRFHTYVEKSVDWKALEADVETFITKFRKQNLAELELGALMNELFAMARRHRVRPVADMALVLVGLVTAEGIGKQLNPESNLFQSTAAYVTPLLAKHGLSPMGAVA